MPAEIGEFKGNAMLILNPESEYPYSFGKKKAELILQHLDEIRLFATTGSLDGGTPVPSAAPTPGPRPAPIKDDDVPF